MNVKHSFILRVFYMLNKIKPKSDHKNKRKFILSLLPLLSCALEHPIQLLPNYVSIDGSVTNQVLVTGSVEVDSQKPDVIIVDTTQRDIITTEPTREASIILTDCGVCMPYFRQLVQWNNAGDIVRINNYDVE